MTIQKAMTGTAVTITLDGRLDTTTSPELETVLKDVLPSATALTFDMSKLAYISSSGLRVLLMAQKQMNKKGPMVLTSVNEIIMEVFEVTGFSDILTFA